MIYYHIKGRELEDLPDIVKPDLKPLMLCYTISYPIRKLSLMTVRIFR